MYVDDDRSWKLTGSYVDTIFDIFTGFDNVVGEVYYGDEINSGNSKQHDHGHRRLQNPQQLTLKEKEINVCLDLMEEKDT